MDHFLTVVERSYAMRKRKLLQLAHQHGLPHPRSSTVLYRSVPVVKSDKLEAQSVSFRTSFVGTRTENVVSVIAVSFLLYALRNRSSSLLHRMLCKVACVL